MPERCWSLPSPYLQAIAFLVLIAGCKSDGSSGPQLVSTAPAKPVPGLDHVEIAGCQLLRRDMTCEAGAGDEIVMWVPGTVADYQFDLGASPVAVSGQPAGSGQSVVFVVEPQTERIRVRHRSGGTRTFAIGAHRSLKRIELANQARRAGQKARAKSLLEQARANGDAVERNRARGLEARMELNAGRHNRAIELLALSSEVSYRQGRLSEASDDVFALVYVHALLKHDVAQAREVLARWRPRITPYPRGAALLAYHDGLFAVVEGDLSAALHHYGLAGARAERLRLTRDARRAKRQQARVLAAAGRLRDAYLLHRQLLPPLDDEGSCQKAHLYSRQAWLSMQLVFAGSELLLRPEVPRWLSAARDSERACGQQRLIDNGLLSQVLWQLESGNVDVAQRLLGEIDSGASTARSPYLEAWRINLWAQVELRRGRAKAATLAFEQELLLGRATSNLDAQLRSLLGLAEVATRSGDRRRAVELYRQAFEALQQGQLLAPLGDLAHTYYAARRDAARRLVSAQVALGDTRAAFLVALSAYRSALVGQSRFGRVAMLPAEQRREFLSALSAYRTERKAIDQAALADWQLSAERLRAVSVKRTQRLSELRHRLQRSVRASVSPVETSASSVFDRIQGHQAWLSVLPGARVWTLLLATSNGVQHAELLAEDAGGLLPGLGAGSISRGSRHRRPALSGTSPILKPFVETLRSRTELLLLPSGAAREIDFAGLKLNGQPVSESMLVAISAGLGVSRPREEAHPPNIPVMSDLRPREVLVVGDPRLDLPYARREAQHVGQVFRGSSQLLGTDATASDLLSALEKSRLFHYAGHAASEGAEGQPALKLAEGTELSAWEILTLRQSPQAAVLSACQSGATSQKTGTAWSLATAFLAAGASAVVAPATPVDDGESLAFQTLFYDALAKRGAGLGVAAAVRSAFWQAQKAASERKLANGSTFRLYVR